MVSSATVPESSPGNCLIATSFKSSTPGTDLVYALLIQCFGVYAWIPNLLKAIFAAVMAWMITLVARQFMAGAISALPALLFASFVMHGAFDATHHWFSTIAVMAGMLVFFDGTSFPRAAAVGALCGLAAFFTQTKGATAVAGFVVYLGLEGVAGSHDPVNARASACCCAAQPPAYSSPRMRTSLEPRDTRRGCFPRSCFRLNIIPLPR